jgi:RNA polymerase sigma-70 factor, ECF subfamily
MSPLPRRASAGPDVPTRPSLIARIKNRADTESWLGFYQFYQPLLMRYMRRLGLKKQVADDVVQDVFVRLLQSLPTFELYSKRGRFRTYLWTLTYSALVDTARRAKARRRVEEEWVKRFHDAGESERETLDNELEAINREQVLDQVLPIVRARTSPTVWRCFELRVLNDRPAAAIAGELGISTNAVYVYASRVLKTVRKKCGIVAEELGDELVDCLPRGV